MVGWMSGCARVEVCADIKTGSKSIYKILNKFLIGVIG